MSRIEHGTLEPGAFALVDTIHDATNGSLLEDLINALVYVLAETAAMMENQTDEEVTETIVAALRGNVQDMRAVQSIIQ